MALVGSGYDAHSKLFITGGATPPDVDLKTAKLELQELVAQFRFESNGDKSRALGSFITPALKAGGFIRGPVPADVAEADQSQSGKTYRQKIIAAVYNERVSIVTDREGGVGSVDETLDDRLIRGRPFIQFDNFRGRLSSRHLEAFLTADAEFGCRVPHRGQIMVRPDKFFIFLSSNGVDTTRDFANRSSIIRIRKHPEGFQFRTYTEGDLLDHARANQSRYLGCVFAVIRAWHKAGCHKTDETRHDFREWVQIVDWIVQNIFGEAPVMDGHRQAQQNVSSPALVFLRAVCLCAEQSQEIGAWITATDIYRLCEGAEISVPGMRQGEDEKKGARIIGACLARLFGEAENLKVDSFVVTRSEETIDRPDGGGTFAKKVYCIKRPSEVGPQ